MGKRAVPLNDALVFPGSQIPERPELLNPDRMARPFARLVNGQSLGQKAPLLYDATNTDAQFAAQPCFDFGGEDLDAEQLQIVIAPPSVVWRSFASLSGENLATISGDRGNVDGGSGNFPGTVAPLRWPPLSVLLQFGTRERAEMIVDCVNGARVNLTASWVRAFGLVTEDAAANQPGTSAAYVFNVFASPGWPTRGSARRTVWCGSVNDSVQSAVFAVPLFASEVSLVACDTATPPVVTVAYIQFYQDSGKAHNVGNYLVSGNQPGPFRVPNGAQYFTVVPQMGEAVPLAAVFDLGA